MLPSNNSLPTNNRTLSSNRSHVPDDLRFSIACIRIEENSANTQAASAARVNKLCATRVALERLIHYRDGR